MMLSSRLVCTPLEARLLRASGASARPPTPLAARRLLVRAQRRDQQGPREQQPYKTVSGTAASIPAAAPGLQPNRRSSRDGSIDEVDVEIVPTNPASSALAKLTSQWTELPAQYKLVFATSMSFVLCNMDKVNISVAILAMSRDFGWSPTISGLVQSSFFYGYLLSQIPGGYAASMLGGRKVLPGGVALWSAATAGVPLLAGTLPGLFLSRAAVGLGEGVAPSAATDLVARAIPTEQRSRAISFIFGGLHVGSLLGLLVAPPLIERFGWPSVFYLFGGVGLVWCLWWEKLMADVRIQDPELADKLIGQGNGAPATTAGHGGHGGVIDAKQAVPWRAFLRNPPLRALGFTHFCNNWFHYTMLAWLPTYFTDSLSLDLTHAAQVSLLPPIAAIAASAIAGPSADALISRGVPVVQVRKAAQCLAFLGPAACLVAASMMEGSPASVGLVSLSLGLASFSLAGLYCNHADLSPRYASVLLGLTNTSGALPGIVGVAFTGCLYDWTGSWGWALFAPSIFFFLAGSATYLKWGSADPQNYSEEANSEPFAIERWIGKARALLPGGGESKEADKKDD